MAKKETTAKKADTKKKAATKKATTKKATPKKKIKIVEEEPVVEEVKEKIDNLEVKNGDPSVIAPVEEIVPEFEVVEEKVEKVVEEKKEKTEKKITKRNDQTFGYFWNGQMIDF